MPTLETAANYAEIIGAFAVLFAIVFAALEFRQLRHQRREAASLEMIRSWQGPEYVNGVFEILQLEDHIQPKSLGELGEQHLKMAFRICVTWEALGVMVHRGTLPIEIVNDLMGGIITIGWRKLDQWVLQLREHVTPRSFEWFEWLATQLENMPAPKLDNGKR
jgi:hypothetical protein